MINLTINGKKVTAREGMTILEAARENGIYIPTLCYHPKLSPLGYCRLCIVEIEGADKPMTACNTPVAEGMVVRTHTPLLEEMRRNILEMLLSLHPEDCLVCPRTGNCELQSLAYRYGVKKASLPARREEALPILEDNAFFVRDYNKCIVCGRCVRACAEVVNYRVLDLVEKGSEARVGAVREGQEVSLEEAGCVFCGSCVQVCPVGALVEKTWRESRTPEWEVKKVRTICPHCGVGCNLEVSVKDDRVVRVRGYDHPEVNQGWTCIKGRFGWDYIYSPERLTKPLIRTGERGEGKFREASWEEALEYAAQGLKRVKERYGADAIAALSSARCTNEENYLMQKFMRAVIGTNNIDNCARTCHAPTVAGLAISFGSGAMTNSIKEIEEMDVLFIMGDNVTEAHPVIGYKMKRAAQRGAKLIVADPRRIELADYAYLWLPLRPGTDIALINSMMNVILTEGLEDRKFIEERTEGFEELWSVVKNYPPERGEEITGVPADKIREAARLYAKTEKAGIFYVLGITEHTTGVRNVMSLANLAMITGHVGKGFCGVNPLRGQNNVQGACDMGAVPANYPGYQKVTDPEARKKFEEAWGVKLSDKPGLMIPQMFQGALEGKIKAMYIMGEEAVLSDLDTTHVKKALSSLEFLIVQDLFLTETAKFADVVFPAAGFLEKEGTFTNTERRVQRVHQAVSPLEGTKPDWQIISQLASRLGYPMEYSSLEEIFNEMASLTPSYRGMSYARLEEKGLQWPCPDPQHPGTPILHCERFARGLGLLQGIEYQEPAELPDEEYPILF